MLESEELIQKVLEISGEKLEFESFDIYGIPSFHTDVLISQEVSTYRVEQQVFTFQVSTKDIVDNEVTIDNEFTFSDGSYTYTFKLDAKPISGIDNWSRLNVLLIGREEV